MTDTPIVRAARALARHESGTDCYDSLDEAMQQTLQDSVRVVLESQWQPISTAPQNGTLVIGLAPTGAGPGYWMHPCVVRHEGKLYSDWQYNDGSQWINWPASAPLLYWMSIPNISLIDVLSE